MVGYLLLLCVVFASTATTCSGLRLSSSAGVATRLKAPGLLHPMHPSTLSASRTSHPATSATRLSSGELLVEASYNLAGGAATLGLLCGFLEDRKGPLAKVFGGLAVVLTLIGGFFAFQTSTLSFRFDDDSFSLVKNDGSNLGENVVVGGDNDWKYKSFVNWDFLPSEDFPILVYFKETQTPESVRVEAPIVVDYLPGQAHFFPAIARADLLKENFIKNGCLKAATGESQVSVKATNNLVL